MTDKSIPMDGAPVEYLDGAPQRMGDQALVRLSNGTVAMVMRMDDATGKPCLVFQDWKIPE